MSVECLPGDEQELSWRRVVSGPPKNISVPLRVQVFEEKSFFSFLINFYWSIVALQCCVSFYCTAK